MRFSIRDLLWLTVVVALGVGWWLDRSALERERERHEEKAAFAAGMVESLMQRLDGYVPGWRKAERHFHTP